jgi:hypothetical protein
MGFITVMFGLAVTVTIFVPAGGENICFSPGFKIGNTGSEVVP